MLYTESEALARAGHTAEHAPGAIFEILAANNAVTIVHVVVRILVERTGYSRRMVQYALRKLEKEKLIERIPPESYERRGIWGTYEGELYLLLLRVPQSEFVTIDASARPRPY